MFFWSFKMNPLPLQDSLSTKLPCTGSQNCNHVIIIIPHWYAKCPIFVYVRYFAIIMSIVLLALSTISCSDKLPLTAAGNSSYQVNDIGTHQHEHKDFCSPFCACSCCAAPVILSITYFTPAPASHTTFTFCETPAGVISDLPTTVWQPPRA